MLKRSHKGNHQGSSHYMEKKRVKERKISRRAFLKFVILVAFALLAITLSRFVTEKGLVTPQGLAHILDTFGPWAPVVFIILEAIAICLFVPATIPIVLGAALFGAYLGFWCGWIGALAGAGGAFIVGRTLGREFIASLFGDRIKRLDDAIERNGFTTVFYLRLLNAPFTPMNYGFSLTKVRFWDYFLGTGLGIAASIFVITFLSGTLKDVWRSGDWNGLISFKSVFSITLFVFSFFIPFIIKRIKGEVPDST